MNIEIKKNREEKKEDFDSRISLRFLRHSIKDSKQGDQDKNIILSKEGRELAVSKKKDLENTPLAKVIGTDRIRTQETGILIMDGELEKKLENSLNKKGMMGQDRISVDNRLNFILKGDEYEAELYKSFGKGLFLHFLINNSDNLVKDGESFTYSRGAKNVAEIVKEYFDSSDRWDNIVKKSHKENEGGKKKHAEQREKTLERIMVSHQGITESFLAKIIEKVKGVQARNNFVSILNNQGFSETEGFKVNIESKNKEKKITISFEKITDNGKETFKFNEEISKEILDEIIKEGNS